MSASLPRPREWLAQLTPYRTNAQVAPVRLQSNEWGEATALSRYLGPSDLDAIALNRYPDIAASELRAALARLSGVLPEQVVVGNGSNEVLLYSFLVFGGPGRTLAVFTPTYTMYARLARLTGMRVHEEPVGVPYLLDAARIRATIECTRPDVVCFSSPNNPTGDAVADETILRAATERERLVIVDEAYAEFSGRSFLPRLADAPNVVVTRTFSKAHAAAGLRVGALVADPRLVSAYEAARLPYNLSALTQLVALRVAQEGAELAARVRLVQSERERVRAALCATPNVIAFPSVANFLLLRHRTRRAADLHVALLARGVLVRDVSAWPGAGESLRATIGTSAENDRLIEAVREEAEAAP